MMLETFFRENNKLAIALSGGVDSAYLMAEAVRSGADVRAFYVKSAFQPGFEREDARKVAACVCRLKSGLMPGSRCESETKADLMSDGICESEREAGLMPDDRCESETKADLMSDDKYKSDSRLTEISLDILSDKQIISNPENRCYYCKLRIMQTIKEAAGNAGYDLVCDGTNASDDVNGRPGFKALNDLGIRSPLRECGITKQEVRKRAKLLGLDVWNKPAYACLATRIACGEPITLEKLQTTEKAEQILFDMGFRDFRVRMRERSALVQIAAGQQKEAFLRENDIKEALSGLYSSVRIDETAR